MDDELYVSEEACTELAMKMAELMQCQYMETNHPDRAYYKTWTSLYHIVRTSKVSVADVTVKIMRRMAMNRRPSNTYEARESDFHAIVHVHPHGPTADGGFRLIIEVLDEFAFREILPVRRRV
jgi:hypothetical protein